MSTANFSIAVVSIIHVFMHLIFSPVRFPDLIYTKDNIKAHMGETNKKNLI